VFPNYTIQMILFYQSNKLHAENSLPHVWIGPMNVYHSVQNSIRQIRLSTLSSS